MSAEYELPDYGGERVLLVEDNPVNQLIAESLLAKANLTVSLANNGQEAVDMVQREKYKLVLMDIMMPVMDGFQSTKVIRSLGGEYSNLTIIAMTAQDTAEDRQTCLASGMNEHVTKPISPENLFATIGRFIEPKGIVIEASANEENQLPTHLTQINLPAAMHRFMNNWIVLRRTLLSFAKSHVDDVQKIETSLAETDLETAIRLAHSLKGSGANIGAEALSKLAAKIEDLLKTNDVEKANSHLPALENLLSKLCEELFSLKEATVPALSNKPASTKVADEVLISMKAVEDSLMLDYGKCQTLVDEVTEKLQGSAWISDWEQVADAVNRFDFAAIKQTMSQLVNDIETKNRSI